MLTTVAGIEPPRGDLGHAADRTLIVVELGLAETRVEGQPVKGVAALRRGIEAVQNQRRILQPDQTAPAHLGLLADRRARARQAVALLDKLGALYEIELLTREDPTPLPRPAPEPIGERIEAIRRAPDWPRKIRLEADAFAKALAGCAGHQKFFDGFGDDDSESEQHMHASILAAASGCACVGIDLEAIEAIMVAVSEDPPPFHALPIKLRRTAKVTLTLPAVATVDDLVARLPHEPFALRWTGGLREQARMP
ncbi:MAG TPA: hypothetical protein VH374_07845 [Polyangia bacterium]|nr:hypothetical protein [Polyangia bacterium]